MKFKINTDDIRVSALWSIYKGMFQVWYTLEQEENPEIPILTSRSYFMGEPPEDGNLHAPWVYMYSYTSRPTVFSGPSDPIECLWTLSRKGNLRRKGERV